MNIKHIDERKIMFENIIKNADANHLSKLLDKWTIEYVKGSRDFFEKRFTFLWNGSESKDKLLAVLLKYFEKIGEENNGLSMIDNLLEKDNYSFRTVLRFRIILDKYKNKKQYKNINKIVCPQLKCEIEDGVFKKLIFDRRNFLNLEAWHLKILTELLGNDNNHMIFKHMISNDEIYETIMLLGNNLEELEKYSQLIRKVVEYIEKDSNALYNDDALRKILEKCIIENEVGTIKKVSISPKRKL